MELSKETGAGIVFAVVSLDNATFVTERNKKQSRGSVFVTKNIRSSIPLLQVANDFHNNFMSSADTYRRALQDDNMKLRDESVRRQQQFHALEASSVVRESQMAEMGMRLAELEREKADRMDDQQAQLERQLAAQGSSVG